MQLTTEQCKRIVFVCLHSLSPNSKISSMLCAYVTSCSAHMAGGGEGERGKGLSLGAALCWAAASRFLLVKSIHIHPELLTCFQVEVVAPEISSECLVFWHLPSFGYFWIPHFC